MTFPLADRSLKCSKGIVEDLLVQVDKFNVPIDFVVLGMKGAPLRQNEHMVLLGRPFMVTTKTMIDVQSGKLTMTILDETVQLQACDSMPYSFSTSHNQCSFVDCYYLLVFDLSFHGKNGAELEAAHSKDRWKRRRRRKWKIKKTDLLFSRLRK